jgi:hypothetical protein
MTPYVLYGLWYRVLGNGSRRMPLDPADWPPTIRLVAAGPSPRIQQFERIVRGMEEQDVTALVPLALPAGQGPAKAVRGNMSPT